MPGNKTVTTDEYKALVRSRWTEAEFTREVIALAKSLGWMVCHFRPARTAKGWRTPVQGDGKGFPDLIMLRRHRMIVAELKVRDRSLTVEQVNWLIAFRCANVHACTWRPEWWPEIESTLK